MVGPSGAGIFSQSPGLPGHEENKPDRQGRRPLPEPELTSGHGANMSLFLVPRLRLGTRKIHTMSRYAQYSAIYRQQFSPAQNAGLPEGPGTGFLHKKRVPGLSSISSGSRAFFSSDLSISLQHLHQRQSDASLKLERSLVEDLQDCGQFFNISRFTSD